MCLSVIHNLWSESGTCAKMSCVSVLKLWKVYYRISPFGFSTFSCRERKHQTCFLLRILVPVCSNFKCKSNYFMTKWNDLLNKGWVCVCMCAHTYVHARMREGTQIWALGLHVLNWVLSYMFEGNCCFALVIWLWMCFQVLLQVIRCGIESHSTLFVLWPLVVDDKPIYFPITESTGLLSVTPELTTCITTSIQLAVLQPVTVMLSSHLLLIFKEAISVEISLHNFCMYFCLPHVCYLSGWCVIITWSDWFSATKWLVWITEILQ